METPRTWDLVLFGATGFTGQLAARYLARTYGGTAVRWAIAGRNRGKLDSLRRKLIDIDASCASVGIIEADVEDERALEEMAGETRCVLTTAGPFAHYGEPVAKACVLRGTHYADITGEPQYVDRLRDRYDELARSKGVRIVNCCGFDSIPHDLGVFYTVQQLPRGVPIDIEGFVRARGKPSGGTWKSALDALGHFFQHRRQRTGKGPRPQSERSVKPLPTRVRHDEARGGWVVPMPTIDPVIVLRSAKAIDEYGPAFRYAHYAVFPRLGPLVGIGLGVGAAFAAAQLPPARKLLERIRPSGEGPTEEERARSWFEVTFVARADGTRLLTRVSGGDPGYDETAKMCTEAALCLALDGDRLPDRAGVITPAAAMGEPLLERLEAAGLRFETLGDV